MSKEFEVVDIWFCRFPSEVAAGAYFEETYNEDDHPISQFAADMGELYYDHDYMELGDYHEPPISDVSGTLALHSFSSSYLAEVVAAFTAKPFVPFNAVLLMWNQEINHPVSVYKPEYTLHYLGRFRCDPAAGPAVSTF